MSNFFKCIHRIAYHGIKPDLTVSFPNLVSSVLEASLLHSESTPYPMAWYAANNVGFLLTNWQIEVKQYPKWNDELTIHTWPVHFKGIVAERAFEVFDEAGSLLALANTGWVFTDLAKRRPARPDAELIAGYGEHYPSALAKDFKLPDYKGYTSVNQAAIHVTRRDTDGNNHANNVSYLEWAMDLIPDHIYDRGRIIEMKTVYKRECLRGMSVLIEAFQNPVNEKLFIVRVTDAAQEVPLLLCEMFFKFGDM